MFETSLLLLMRRFPIGWITVLLLFCGSVAAHAEEAPHHAGFLRSKFIYTTPAGRVRERSVFLWYPTDSKPTTHSYAIQKGVVAKDALVAKGKHPLILFCHGYLGSADQVVFLTEALSRAGYIVASLNHADSLDEQSASGKLRLPKFADVDAWSDKTVVDRKEDMQALLSHMLTLNDDTAHFLHGHVDASAIGIAGHSLGGYTALGLVGAWPSWKDTRIRAALILSPFTAPLLKHGDLTGIEVPVMLQGGTLDAPLTPLLPAVYKKLSSSKPKYLFVFDQATHLSWTNFPTFSQTTRAATEAPGIPKLIADYSIAFFDHTLRHAPSAPLHIRAPGVTTLEVSDGLSDEPAAKKPLPGAFSNP